MVNCYWHVQPHNELEPELKTSNNDFLSFLQAMRIITTILYERKFTTSTALYLATVLLNSIENELAILKQDVYNPALVDASLIKLKELTVHSYDVCLKEKRNTRSIKNVMLVDLLQNDLHSVKAYINTTNAVTSIPIFCWWLIDLVKFS
ncbi:12997_t:CDS:2 [Funneliformis mosseae]|uniref:12997_t:CDS:1 n=1 Tax=Funneliformis mosseae TaxID=27381 RepID=A0A9N9CFB7_FUNMO|nr:12997_t:CDS:2 [Funneliformis mosseae]